MSEAAAPDALFGGRLHVAQPRKGHRAGTDAVLLAAAAGRADRVVDLGAGVGTVGLALLALGRVRRAVLVEREPEAARLACVNIALNRASDSAVVVEADVAAPARALRAAGLEFGQADLVVCNPPFNDPGRHRASPDRSRARAHAMGAEGMEPWLKCAARCLAGAGRLVMIHRPEALPWLLPMVAARFGGLSLLPVHPAPREPASRILIGARLNTKAPARLSPALVLHGEGGAFTSEAAALHAGERELAL